MQLTRSGILHPAVNSWTKLVGIHEPRGCSPGSARCESCKFRHLGPNAAEFMPGRETPNDYFTVAGSRHSGVETPGTGGLLPLLVGIAMGTSFETMLVTPLALIARTT